MSDTKQQGGNNRCDAISVQDLLDGEEVPVPAYLREDNNPDMGDEDLPISNYTSRTIHEQEKEKMWPRVWQVVCREEDILKAGELYIHDCVETIANISENFKRSIFCFSILAFSQHRLI